MERFKIGKIVNAVALRGEVKVYNYSDYKERYEEIDRVIAGTKEYEIEKVRYQQNMVILKLKGVNDRNAAEAMKGIELFITEDDLRDLDEDTFYIKDLVGMDVIDDNTKKKVGTLNDVIQNSAQDIYKIKLNSGNDALIPVVKEFIKEVNLEHKTILITPIPGMIDDEGLSDQEEDENED